MISGRTRIYGLVGHPVRHSLSPAMHNALFGKLSLDAVYLAFDVDPRRAEGVTDAIRTLDLVGVNLTVPFKERVLPPLDHVTIAAEEAGAVNVVINVDGWLTGYNTDGEGLLGALAEEHGFNAKAQRCVVLGAGGAGRAVASALAAAVRLPRWATDTRVSMALSLSTAGPHYIQYSHKYLAHYEFNGAFRLQYSMWSAWQRCQFRLSFISFT